MSKIDLHMHSAFSLDADGISSVQANHAIHRLRIRR